MTHSSSGGWENVIYNSYEELPASIGSYDNSEWIEKQIYRVDNINSEMELMKHRNRLLIDTVNQYSKNQISILDYGGGFGLSYYPLVDSTSKTINYSIVEISGVCEAAKKYVNGVSFYPTIPCFLEFDICYIRTSLQYAEDWKGVLENMIKTNPTFLVFSDLSIGDIKTFLTLQLWGSQRIPYWFINKAELIDFVSGLGYNVVLDEISQHIEGLDAFKSCKKYPKEYQITSLFDLVFERS